MVGVIQITRLIDIVLSGKFQENRIIGSPDICLGTKYFTLVQFGKESPTHYDSVDFTIKRSHTL